LRPSQFTLTYFFEFLNVALDSGHVSIQVGQVLSEETGGCTSVNDCLLHQELEQEHSTWTLSNMVLALFSENLGATVLGK
jgi:hypothetical protein